VGGDGLKKKKAKKVNMVAELFIQNEYRIFKPIKLTIRSRLR
jgi:hypothetical protein